MSENTIIETVTGFHLYKEWGDPFKYETAVRATLVWDLEDEFSEIKTLPRRICCNRILKPLLEQAFRNVIERDLACEILTWDGCYQRRAIRGYEEDYKVCMERHYQAIKKNHKNVEWLEKAMMFLSVHSWGFGFDINQAWNGLGQTPRMSPELVKCFTDAGLEWGGYWKRKDGMHFQPLIQYLL